MTGSRTRLRVAIAQLNVTVGDIETNADRIIDTIERSRREDANVVVFSELALLGYPPRDMVHRRGILDRQRRALETIADHTDDNLATIVGFAGRNPESSGHSLINAAAFCGRGDVLLTTSKQLLPTYDVFDECRYFHPADTGRTIGWNGVEIGLSICEDAWADVEASEMPDYDTDPIAELVDRGADVIINIAASPFSLDKADIRRDLLTAHCRRHRRPMIFVNQVGANEELIFDGRSLVVDASGSPRARLAEFEEDVQLVDIDGDVEPIDDNPFRPQASSRAEQARDAVVVGLRDYVHKSNFDDVIIGLSGGIDSSVTAALAADALGAGHVRAVAMPSQFSSDHSLEDARRVSQNLGIDYDEIPIESPYDSILGELTPHFDDESFGVTEENIQARIRGLYLMALSNKTGSLVLACGNKSELAVGYCTLYGDMCGALAVIGDLPKMLVYDVARLYNGEADGVVIPQRVIDKPPSAELRPDQQDEDSLPPYEILDDILRMYIVEHRTIDEIVEQGHDDATVRRIIELVHRNEYKRSQAPPVLKVTDKAFGCGWRYPLAAIYSTEAP